MKNQRGRREKKSDRQSRDDTRQTKSFRKRLRNSPSIKICTKGTQRVQDEVFGEALMGQVGQVGRSITESRAGKLNKSCVPLTTTRDDPCFTDRIRRPTLLEGAPEPAQGMIPYHLARSHSIIVGVCCCLRLFASLPLQHCAQSSVSASRNGAG